MNFPSREKIEELRANFTKGSHIYCIRMVGEPQMTGQRESLITLMMLDKSMYHGVVVLL